MQVEHMLKSGQFIAQLARQEWSVQSAGLVDWTDSSGGTNEDTTDVVEGKPLLSGRTAEPDALALC